jgi:hypothetical protein
MDCATRCVDGPRNLRVKKAPSTSGRAIKEKKKPKERKKSARKSSKGGGREWGEDEADEVQTTRGGVTLEMLANGEPLPEGFPVWDEEQEMEDMDFTWAATLATVR